MSLANQVYVLSGALPSGKSRKDKTAELVAAGATVGKSVTKSTTHL
jgi:NAD-dependent DNA ligase|tara:strand:- start:521 stop:658 length:138 start_codon:yes stop_codon:yes gene_type:complete